MFCQGIIALIITAVFYRIFSKEKANKIVSQHELQVDEALAVEKVNQ